jgi:glutathione peroxidase
MERLSATLVFAVSFAFAGTAIDEAFASAGTCGADSVAQTSFYDLKVKSVEGDAVNLSTYKGKVALVVNTASRCGYTSQYKDLQAVFAKYKDQGLVVLGFPSNDFGGQEPGTNKDIKAFCETNFNVKFPLFEKAPVTGKEIQPAFQYLTANSAVTGPVEWNFEKFLVDRNGKVVARFKSKVSPAAKEVSSLIEDKLKEKSTCTSSI